ncbi:MAG: hypothetical protein RPS47_04925 [Colwellia sp.]
MHPLLRHKHADDDLKSIVSRYKAATGSERKRLKSAIGRIVFILEAMAEDEGFQDRLLIDDKSDENGAVNFRKWIAQHRLGNDLWRVKLWQGPDLVKFRIIYAYQKIDPFNHLAKFHVLAIVDRDKFNYEGEHESDISARIINDYRSL